MLIFRGRGNIYCIDQTLILESLLLIYQNNNINKLICHKDERGKMGKKRLLVAVIAFLTIMGSIGQTLGSISAYALSSDEGAQEAQTFFAEAEGITVSASANKGVFPEGTIMQIRRVSTDDMLSEAQLLELNKAEIVDAAAVDITFYKDGQEIQPADSKSVHVTITTDSDVEGDNHVLVHIDDNGNTSEVQTADAAAADFDAYGFSIYAIIGYGDKLPATVRYQFYLNKDDETPYNEQIVKEGDMLSAPAMPVNGDKTFTGWFEDGAEDPFTGFGKVGQIAEEKTVKLYASFADTVYVFYHDQNGEIIRTDAFVANQTIEIYHDAPNVELEDNRQSHIGWSLEKGGKTDVSGKMTLSNKNVDLYPMVKSGLWITFEANGGAALDRQFIAADVTDRKVIKKETYKQGYTFAGWYADKALTTEWDFSKDAEGSMTVYAKWEAAEVEYAVKYYRQDPNDTSKDILIKQVNKKGITGSDAVFDLENDLLEREKFGLHLDEARTEAAKIEIKPDGSTIRKVYFLSNEHTITFTWKDEEGTARKASIGIKYLEDTRKAWDLVKPFDTFKDGRRWAWNPIEGGVIWFKSSLEYQVMSYNQDINARLEAVAENNHFSRSYYETLDGVAPEGRETVEVEGKLYYLESLDAFRAGSGAAVALNRGTKFNVDPLVSDGNIKWLKSRNRYVLWFHAGGSGYLQSKYNGTYEFKNDPDGYMDIYFKRMRYNLIFHENGGADLEDVSSIPYERKIAQYNPAGYTKGMIATINGREFKFAGWYENAELMGDEFTFDDDKTMPDRHINLYAKWAPITYTVKFDTGKGTKLDDVTGVAHGSRIKLPEIPVYEDHTFTGWTLGGRPYSFESGVTRDITLVAHWKNSKTYSVRYDLNGGAGTLPEDNNAYYDTAEAEVLPLTSYTAPAGKVFIGWLSEGDGMIYYPGSKVKTESDIVLKAQWEDRTRATGIKYDFNFDSFGIKSEGDSFALVYGIMNNGKVKPADFAQLHVIPEGYVFTGWYLDPECTKGPVTELMVDKENEKANVLYAGWKKVEMNDPNPNTDKPSAPVTSDDSSMLAYCWLLGASLLMMASAKALKKSIK